MKKLDLTHLNPEQARAVTTIDKPVLILAGAGSGKTRVITYRIAHLIATCGVTPHQVLALTFTNKAAGEMRERAGQLLGRNTRGMTIATFHSLCVRFLRETIHLLGYHRDFVIFDSTAQLSAIKTIFEDEEIDPKTYNMKSVFYEIMKAKGRGEGPDRFLDQRQDPWAQITGQVFQEYNQTLKGCNALDFEDILHFTIDIFRRFPAETLPLKQRYQHIMVDEYQDTNRVQYQLIRYLTEFTHNLCVVGDDDQSIYGWRGADLRNILDFQQDYPEAEVIKLEQNYRSTQTILGAANDVIVHNRDRMDKKLWTRIEGGAPIRWVEEETPREELEQVVYFMSDFKQQTGLGWSNFAFLYRSNYQSRAIEEVLRDNGIPYQLIGGTKFFDRKEIQDCLAYMRFLHNLRDEVSLFRIINYPKRDIGKSTIEILTRQRIERGLSLFEMMTAAREIDELKARAKKSVASFVELILNYREKLTQEPFEQVFRDFFQRIDLKGEIEKDEKVEEIREMKVNNHLEFVNTLYLYGDRRRKAQEGATLTDFLEYVSLFTDTDEMDQRKGKVSLLTVHSAKGLEFEYVAIVGLTDGQFPNHNAVSDDATEEERRLFYVAVTRARQALCLSMPRTRMQYGEWVHNEPSRFLQEIGPQYFETPPFTADIDPDVQAFRTEVARSRFFDRYRHL
jgi:DNA helicase II / ATP-dependent DNA helicase PcrA